MERAFEAEYNSLMSNETRELVPLPENLSIVDSKWVLKVKRDANGVIDRHKARLVARGFAQEEKIMKKFLILKYQSITRTCKRSRPRNSPNGC